MKPQNFLILILLTTISISAVFIIYSCEKIEKEREIKVTTQPVSNISATTARATGIIIDLGEGITQHGFCWSTNQNPTINDSKTQKGSKNSTGEYSSDLTGLIANTIYNVRAYASNVNSTVYGDEKSFKTYVALFTKSLGGSDDDQPYFIQQTTDGGYVVAGLSMSNDGDVSGNHGEADYWIVKLTSGGDKSWQKSLGGSNKDHAGSIQQTTDGGYIVAGYSVSTDGDVSGNHGEADYWIVKLISGGDISWQKSLGGSSYDWANTIQQTSDGGYVVAGFSMSNDGDVSGNHGKADNWIVKLTSGGDISWQKSFGGSGYDFGKSIQQTTDGGFIVAGISESTDGDVSGNHGAYDYWIIKLTTGGNISWQKSLGGSDDDLPFSIQQTTDGGYVVAGYSASTDGDVTGNHGARDYWIVKLTSGGDISWQKSKGGSDDDLPFSIQQTTDGGYVVAGESKSTDGDVTGNHGGNDYWIIKIPDDE